MSQSDDERWMKLALALGRRHLGLTWPNPSVGCVIVKEGRMIGQGVTAPGGRPHAEPQALAMAGSQAKGAAVYVTLEPCAHQGQTPPCASALIDAQVERVVMALQDPDPRVDGGGIAMLQAAGIKTELGVCAAEATFDQIGFLSTQTKSRPHLTLKLAQSLDGRIATASGESQWITGPAARKATHVMRAQSDAIMIGTGTLDADDPSLDVRLPGLEDRSPIRVILSSSGQIAPDAKMLKDNGPDIWMLSPASLGQESPVRNLKVQANADGKPNLNDAFRVLKDQGITRVFCEGGAGLAASLIRDNLVDRLMLFSAPIIMGGTSLPSISDIGLDKLVDAPKFVETDSRPIGPDRLTIYERA